MADRRTYLARYKELNEQHGASRNIERRTVLIPKFLWETWLKKKSQFVRPFSDFIGVAMLFGLYGAHPFSDPTEGLEEAIRVYENQEGKEREVVVRMIRKIAAMYGLEVIIKGQDDV